jgi:long-chain acyl-CoA synthetase
MNEQQECARFAKYKDLILEDGQMFYAGKLLRRAVQRFGASTALIFRDQQISYRELYYRACLLSEKIRLHGIQPGDRVLLLFENSIEFYIAYFGAWQMGAVVAPLNVFLKEKELAYIVNDANPAVVLTSRDKVALFASFQGPIMTDADMDLVAPAPAHLVDIEVPTISPDAMAVLLYTSGTTGFPKGVMLSSKNILSNFLQGVSRLPLDFGQRVFAVLPLFHSFAQLACVWASVIAGCTVIVVPKIERKAILQALHHKPTVFLGVPALYGLLCLLKTADLTSVLFFMCGADALPDKIRMGFELIYRRKLCNGYGLTETSPVIAVDIDDELCPTGTVGRPMLGISCSIRDAQGHELVQGQTGVLWVKGDNVMLGYYHAPEKTDAILRDGWLNTGDVAYVDTRGKLVVCGREKDLVVHKGLKIYPPEVENIIMMHPAVLYVGVVGRPDEEVGEVPIAFVQVRSVAPGLERELRSLCDEHLATYKIPRAFIILDTMPLTATGKVDKKVLRVQLK